MKKININMVVAKQLEQDYFANVFELTNIKESWFNKLRYYKTFWLLNFEMNEFFNSKFDEIYFQESDLKIPDAIENISMQNYLSLQSVDGETAMDIIVTFVAHSIHEANKLSIEVMTKRLWKTNYKIVIGLYNELFKQMNEANKKWNQLFAEVEVVDNDYMEAGGDSLNKFSTLNNIKAACQDFNVEYSEAWKLPYSIVQTNALAKASANHVQERLTKIKERKMRQQRK